MMEKEELMENLFNAVDIIVNERINEIPQDKIIKCTIVDISSAEEGKYTVTDGSSEFAAYTDNTSYKEDMVVYVLIPKGDYSLTKTILTRYITENTTL